MELLQVLAPVSQGYAALPVPDAFNWQDATAELGDGEWYLVAFRSIRRPDADEDRLSHFDELAHQEAASSPGFVHYFKGPRATDGSCLSFCLWTSRADARAAAGRPDHVRAVGLIDEMYQTYTLEFHRVTREAGWLTFAPYDPVPAHGAPADGAPGHVAPAYAAPAGSSAPTLGILPAPAG